MRYADSCAATRFMRAASTRRPKASMDTQRVILFIVFSFSIFLLWDAWQKEKARPISAPRSIESPVPPVGSALPTAPPEAKPALESAETVEVKTNLVSAEISLSGGDLRRLELLTYEQQDDLKRQFVLLETTPAHTYVAQSGLIGESLPNHKTLYTAEAKSYELNEGADKVEIVLNSANQGGITVVKTFTFYR
ncbi:MAG TPA: membrane protein insertase YidC, partial [Burkholderiales bacterium]|nr:membrane protein insertase YidC [Burkholderiales bacterium]